MVSLAPGPPASSRFPTTTSSKAPLLRAYRPVVSAAGRARHRGAAGHCPRAVAGSASDVCRRRGQRAERRYDDGQIGEAVIRLIEALARRGEFASVWQIRAAADRIAVDAIDRLRAEGSSWVELAAQADLSRQGLAQWRVSASRAIRGQRSVAR